MKQTETITENDNFTLDTNDTMHATFIGFFFRVTYVHTQDQPHYYDVIIRPRREATYPLLTLEHNLLNARSNCYNKHRQIVITRFCIVLYYIVINLT